MREIQIKEIFIGSKRPLCLISGPCVIESEAMCLKSAERLKAIAEKAKVPLIFKSSYDKANRSSGDSFRGPGLKEGLRILRRVQEEFNLAVVSDVHSVEEVKAAGEVLDLIQIPAFLSRQTDLILAAAETGKPIQVKKGQFLAPWDMKNVVQKIESCGNHNILLVDRGTSFGYNNLVSDMRAIPVMRGLGYPVCFDATHAVQLPGGLGDKTGGQREFVLLLARSALAAGASALFMEAHETPEKALSDASSMLSFDELERALPKLRELHELIQKEWE